MYYFKATPAASSLRPAVTFSAVPTVVGVGSAVTQPSTLVPTSAPSLTPAAPPSPEAGAAGWSQLQPGLERRVMKVYNAQNQQVESLYTWRLDQRYFRLDVAYNERPKTLDTWQKETNAALVVNGGYFSVRNEKYYPDGLAVMHGQSTGQSFSGYGGMLAIHPTGAELRWLVDKPYKPSESLQAALQSFPILVEPGGGLGFPLEKENNARARRTVIAQDKDGRILFLLAPNGYFTLHQLSVYLTESDLNLDVALNLDGGGSTGILVANPREMIAPGTLLPFVVLVYPR